jgi:glutathione S-transferase
MTKSNATCETCPYWEVFPNDVAGACHHSVNRFDTSRAYHKEWWCSEHPDRQRDRLAAMAMQGLAFFADKGGTGPWIAGRAYAIADAMLDERKKEK